MLLPWPIVAVRGIHHHGVKANYFVNASSALGLECNEQAWPYCVFLYYSVLLRRNLVFFGFECGPSVHHDPNRSNTFT